MSSFLFSQATPQILFAGNAAFHIGNPGGPVELNPQPLPPRVYMPALIRTNTNPIIWQ